MRCVWEIKNLLTISELEKRTISAGIVYFSISSKTAEVLSISHKNNPFIQDIEFGNKENREFEDSFLRFLLKSYPDKIDLTFSFSKSMCCVLFLFKCELAFVLLVYNYQNKIIMETIENKSEEGMQIPFMNTLTACANKLTKDGYTDTLLVSTKGLYSTLNDKTYGPEEVKAVNFYRFEGQSDPGDNAILYVIETCDGAKGMIIDAFGLYADDAISKFMSHVDDLHKKVSTKNAA